MIPDASIEGISLPSVTVRASTETGNISFSGSHVAEQLLSDSDPSEQDVIINNIDINKIVKSDFFVLIFQLYYCFKAFYKSRRVMVCSPGNLVPSHNLQYLPAQLLISLRALSVSFPVS